jgi:DNA-binding NarL/FixJ family response regulator
MSADGLMKALELILSGVSYFPMDLIARHTSTFSGKGETSFNGQVLTAKEMDVIELLVAGHTNKEIGRSLDIEEVTVKARLKQAFRKLGVRNRAQAVRVALENKLL